MEQTSNPLGSPKIRDLTPAPPEQRSDKTATGFVIPVRKRSEVMKDFEAVAGPLRGENREDA